MVDQHIGIPDKKSTDTIVIKGLCLKTNVPMGQRCSIAEQTLC